MCFWGSHATRTGKETAMPVEDLRPGRAGGESRALVLWFPSHFCSFALDLEAIQRHAEIGIGQALVHSSSHARREGGSSNGDLHQMESRYGPRGHRRGSVRGNHGALIAVGEIQQA